MLNYNNIQAVRNQEQEQKLRTDELNAMAAEQSLNLPAFMMQQNRRIPPIGAQRSMTLYPAVEDPLV
jgi:hypothetical protein